LESGVNESNNRQNNADPLIRKGLDPITARRHDMSAEVFLPTFEPIAAQAIADAKERSTNDKVRHAQRTEGHKLRRIWRASLD
jgi:hypothetical protein